MQKNICTGKSYKHFERKVWIQSNLDKLPKCFEINNMKLSTEKWKMLHTEKKNQMQNAKPNHFSGKHTVDYGGCRLNTGLQMWSCCQNFGPWFGETFINWRHFLCCYIWQEVWCQRFWFMLTQAFCYCFLFSQGVKGWGLKKAIQKRKSDVEREYMKQQWRKL